VISEERPAGGEEFPNDVKENSEQKVSGKYIIIVKAVVRQIASILALI